MALIGTKRYSRVFALLLITVLVFAMPVSAAPTYAVVRNISGDLCTGLTRPFQPTEISVDDSSGELYILNNNSNKVVGFFTDGSCIGQVNSAPNATHMVLAENEGSVFLTTEPPTNSLYMYDGSWNFQGNQALTAQPGALTDCYDSSYSPYAVSMAYPNGTVDELLPSTWGGEPVFFPLLISFSGPANPVAITCAPDITTTSSTLVYIINTSGISFYDAQTGTLRTTMDGFTDARAIAVESYGPYPKRLYVGDGTMLRIYSPSTTARDQYTLLGTISLPSTIEGIAVDKDNMIYVTTADSNLIGVYAVRPTVTAVSPSSGPLAGGTLIMITGTGFLDGNSTHAVKFGGADAATYTVNSDTQITATAPAGTAGTIDVTVSSPFLTSTTSAADHFMYAPAPTVTGISPTTGPCGYTTVTITGTGFTGATAVTFEGTPASPSAPTASTTLAAAITATSTTISLSSVADFPAGPNCVIIDPGLTEEVVYYQGISGTTLTGVIRGYDGTTATSHMIGTTVSTPFTYVRVDSDTQITTISPPGPAGKHDITVTTPVGTSATSTADQFTYVLAPAPYLNFIAPSSGPTTGGTNIVISGGGFFPGATVSFGGIPGIDVNVPISSVITAITPPYFPPGPVDVVVTNPDSQIGELSDGFTYIPTVTPVLDVDEGSSGTFTQGQTGGTLTVTVSNTGSASSATWGTTTVTETLPSGFSATSFGGSGWSCSGTNAVTCTGTQAVAGGSSFPEIDIAVAVPAAASNPTGTNAATASGGGASASATSGTVSIPVVQVPATMGANSGTTPQSVAVNTAVANPLSVTVQDAAGNPVPGVSVTFTAPASGASGTFSDSTNTITVTTNAAGVASAGSFTANTVNGGPYTVTATATGLSSVNFDLTNTAGTATHVAVTAPGTAISGSPFSITVTALDQLGDTATGYTGTVHFTSTDSAATLPADYTFTGGDAGTHTFTLTITLNTAGAQTITATDPGTSSITGTSGAVAVRVPLIGIGAITGTPQVGDILTNGTVTPAAATVNYQWNESASINGPYSPISGATSETYTPVAGDMGNYIEVNVTGTGSYTGFVNSTPVGPVTVAPVVTPTPTQTQSGNSGSSSDYWVNSGNTGSTGYAGPAPVPRGSSNPVPQPVPKQPAAGTQQPGSPGSSSSAPAPAASSGTGSSSTGSRLSL